MKHKTILMILLMFTVPLANAIRISIISEIKDTSALGFSIKGEKNGHGGLGKSYTKDGMPKGATYSVGFRKSIFGDDITCYTRGKHPKTYRKLSRDVTIVLRENKQGQCRQYVYYDQP